MTKRTQGLMLKASQATLDAWHADDRNFERELDGTPGWLRLTREALKAHTRESKR